MNCPIASSMSECKKNGRFYFLFPLLNKGGTQEKQRNKSLCGQSCSWWHIVAFSFVFFQQQEHGRLHCRASDFWSRNCAHARAWQAFGKWNFCCAFPHTQKKQRRSGPSLRITMGIRTMGRDFIHCHIYAYSAPYHGDIIQIVKLIFDATKGTFGFR